MVSGLSLSVNTCMYNNIYIYIYIYIYIIIIYMHVLTASAEQSLNIPFTVRQAIKENHISL